MTRLWCALALAACLALAAACAAPPAPAVAVEGQPADVAQLAGEWNGAYFSADTGRSGSIRLTLEAGEGIAYGDVLMFTPREEALTPAEPGPHAANQPATQTLSIRFVAVAGDHVSGTIEPYRDPECGCLVSTTFHGRLRGNRIEGTYVTQAGGGHQARQGRWQVERKKG